MNKNIYFSKTSAFGSLTSLALLAGMLTCFFLALPSMWVTSLGKVFAVSWGIFTGAAVWAHGHALWQHRKQVRLRRSLDALSYEMQLKRRLQRKRSYLPS